ncbi:MAG: amidohydrolase [Candidatus Bathyarchaeota archaeon]|nr:amidohydrolase [Candidatus Bathyarchaeota archaeon]MDH5787225.1 amidohydrolase [Candidatus Bathyarchaeota archaeon]
MGKADLLIYGCAIVAMNGKNFIENGAIVVKNGVIASIGKSTSVENIRAEKKINAKGKVALPGLINCHTHVPMTLFRGLVEDRPLDSWLKETIWPLETKLKPEDVYAGALLGCLEMIRSGTTCFADMYFHEDMVAKAVEKSGLRGILAEGIIESGNKALGERMFERSIDFAKNFRGHANGRVGVMVGPHAAYSCSPSLLIKVGVAASQLKVGIHLHLAESNTMFKKLGKKRGPTEVESLAKAGFLEGHVLAAHCINLSMNDMRILSERGVNVVYVPVANMKLGLGVAKIVDLLRFGVNVSLGTDGAASNNVLDMFEAMKIGSLLQKIFYKNPTVLPAYDVLKMGTIDGAEALSLEKNVGSLEKGKKADIVLVDLSKPHLKPLHNIYSSLVYAARGSDVDTVIVDGKILMEKGQVTTLDEQSVMEKAETTAFDLVCR